MGREKEGIDEYKLTCVCSKSKFIVVHVPTVRVVFLQRTARRHVNISRRGALWESTVMVEEIRFRHPHPFP